MDVTVDDYKTGGTVLQHPTVYECTPVTVQPDDAAITVDGDMKVLKAGTFYPANDATVKGIVLQDYRVEDTPVQVALIYAGTVNESKLPAVPADGVKAALPRITFSKK